MEIRAGNVHTFTTFLTSNTTLTKIYLYRSAEPKMLTVSFQKNAQHPVVLFFKIKLIYEISCNTHLVFCSSKEPLFICSVPLLSPSRRPLYIFPSPLTSEEVVSVQTAFSFSWNIVLCTWEAVTKELRIKNSTRVTLFAQTDLVDNHARTGGLP